MLKLFTFCVDIKKYSRATLNSALRFLVISLEKHVKDYELIVFSNYPTTVLSKNVKYRKFYESDTFVDIIGSKGHSLGPMFGKLAFSKMSVYKDLHDETGEDYIWVDIDTIVTSDISYLKDVKNIFVEIGGPSVQRNPLFRNNLSITVPRNRYIQGNFWKLDVDLYNNLVEVYNNIILKRNLHLRYTLQDLFSYYILIHKEDKLDDVYVYGRNFMENTLNGLSQWGDRKQGHYTHPSIQGLERLYWDKDKLINEAFPNLEIHLLSFTQPKLNLLKTTPQFLNVIKNMNKQYNKKNLNGWALPEEAFEWLLLNLPEGSTILELGSGLGTRELVKYYTVYSVEQDQKWMGYEPKSNYIYAPLKSYPNDIQGSQGWYDEERLFAGIPEKYDLLIIDGPIGINRGNFTNFCERFDASVPFIIDDTQRKIDRDMALQVAEKLNKSVTEITGHQKKFIILK